MTTFATVRNLRRPRYAAPVLHLCVFVLTWVLYWVNPQPLFDGPANWPFSVIFFADLPISVIAFGAMFTSSESWPRALVAWGVLGTLWWYILGCGLEFLWGFIRDLLPARGEKDH